MAGRSIPQGTNGYVSDADKIGLAFRDAGVPIVEQRINGRIVFDLIGVDCRLDFAGAGRYLRTSPGHRNPSDMPLPLFVDEPPPAGD